jgi:hypothetical protein
VVFTWGALVQRTLLAAQQAERDGVSVAVVDLRSIIPYDWDTIAAHVRRVNRVIVVHEDQLTCGFGAEIAARIAGDLFDQLDAPVRRVAAMDTPVAAYTPVLEEVILPGSADVLKTIKRSPPTRRGRADRIAPDATIDSRVAVDLSFALPPGRSSPCSANGAGKTTTLRMLAG